MDTLLSPDIGLLIWTIISFLVLVGLLYVLAWGPLVGAVEAREERLRAEREAAEKARAEAERIQGDLEKRLADADAAAAAVMAGVNKDAEVLRATLKGDAQKEAWELLEKTRAQLAEEKRRLVGELRDEVASLSVLAAERLVKKSVDSGVKKSVLDRFFGELDKPEKKN